MENLKQKSGFMQIAVLGSIILLISLVVGTLWTGRKASQDTEKAVRSVSLFYLDELAGRREQVVASNLRSSIDNIYAAIGLMDEDDLSDLAHLQAYQRRMKQLYGLERFAFVDTDGLVYTSQGTKQDIDDYSFDYLNLAKPEISVKNLFTKEKKVIIAVPIDGLTFSGKKLNVCFMEIDMSRMLAGVSLQANENKMTFCNIYTREGISLTEAVLGGLASEDNLLDALGIAQYEPGYSYEKVLNDFKTGTEGVVSFVYNDIRETLYYKPVEGTEWLLTYLIRESLISEQISSISAGIIRRSLIQTGIIALILFILFGLIMIQTRKNAALALEKETSEAESRIRQRELERRLSLQEKLLEQEKQRAQQERMITALSADYRSVYYIDLDKDEGICYQAYQDLENGLNEGERFAFHEIFADYAQKYVVEQYREEFLRFIEPSAIQAALAEGPVASYRYLVNQNGKESYEMLRFAGVWHGNREESDSEEAVHAVGACFTDVDAETRKTMQQSQTLSEALTAAEMANKAKTAFLSNMSHEIRTPMNAIIGLDNIALNDPGVPEKTRGYLEKIGTSAQHLLSIINDILDMSRIESGRMVIKSEEFSFSKMLEQVNTIISGQCRDKGLQYECRMQGDISDYYIGDDMKLRQVMINILGNAVKFTPEGGSVTFLVEEMARFDGKSTLRFTIRDTGIGMSKEFIPKLFDAFSQEDSSSTNKYGSTGLGMPITKSIVELMNGRIEVDSEKGVGTTFVVTITLKDYHRKKKESNAGDLKPEEMCVLVIDDDPVACEHAKVVLQQVGIECEIALSGIQAIDMVQVRHVRREPYNLILVDWKMPELDGIETTKRIREIVGYDTAIIILTSYNWDDILEEAISAGVDSFVGKPLFVSTVMDEFQMAFRKKLEEKEAHKPDLRGRRILLAEDVDVNAEIMQMVLSMREMETERAENGKIAVEMFASNPAGYFDAILMDMRMPEMDGLTATSTIRAMDREDAKKIPIIALTANAFDEDVQRSMQAGLDAHLSKPVDPDLLFQTLKSFIR